MLESYKRSDHKVRVFVGYVPSRRFKPCSHENVYTVLLHRMPNVLGTKRRTCTIKAKRVRAGFSKMHGINVSYSSPQNNEYVGLLDTEISYPNDGINEGNASVRDFAKWKL